jgi:chromosomal replication initiation ATPase DnaA
MPEQGRQLALDLPPRIALGRDDFLVTRSNAGAVQAIDAWPAWPAPALFLVGPAGSGKSHLAEIWRSRSSAQCLPAGKLTAEAVPGLLATGALLVEDAPGSSLEEQALFHLLNLAREERASLVVTSRTPPAQWKVALPDLRSRLRGGFTVVLGPPDDELLRGVLVKHFADRQIAADEAIISYMMSRMERSLEAARRLVAEIDARSLADRQEVTRSLVATVLRDLQGTPLWDHE